MNEEITNMLTRSTRLMNKENSSLKVTLKMLPIELLKSLFYKQPMNREYRYFFWPSACLALALEIGHNKTRHPDLLAALTTYYRRWERKRCRLFFLDQLMNGYTLLFLFQATETLWIQRALSKMYYFARNYPKTTTGSFPYRTTASKFVLVDSLGMLCPFLSRYGSIFNCEHASLFSVNALTDFLRNGMDNVSGLPYHGFTSDTYKKLGVIGWGRGVGWLLIGLVNTLAFLDTSIEAYDLLLDRFRTLAHTSVKYQDKNGFFRWMLNATDGHVDTSSTAMIGYSLKRAMDLDFLDETYTHYVNKAFQALLSSTKKGLVFNSSAECQGLGMHPQRYEWNLWGQGFGTAFAVSMMT